TGIATNIINGACGPANGVAVGSAPTANLCSAGTASTVTGSGPWSWPCIGSNGGTTANCSAPLTQATTGNVITAASCSQANVQTAMNSANDGDTVIVPAGTCTWSGGPTFSNTK